MDRVPDSHRRQRGAHRSERSRASQRAHEVRQHRTQSASREHVRQRTAEVPRRANRSSTHASAQEGASDQHRAPRSASHHRKRSPQSAPRSERHAAPSPLASNALVRALQQSSMLKYAVAALAVLVAALLLWHPWSTPATAPAPEAADTANEAAPLPATLEEALAAQPVYASLQPADFSAIKTTDKSSTIGFTMVGGDAPALSTENQAALDEALAYYGQNDIPVGFILMDIGSGRGFARNIDERIYGASMFKAPYCAYLLSQQIEQGDYALSSAVLSGTMSDSGYFSYNGRQAAIESLIGNSIIYSDNAAYGALRSAFSDADLAAWLESLGANGNMAYDDWFPHCTARDAARLWSAIYAYLQTGTEGAQLLDELCASTEMSFMRAALTGSDAGSADDAMLEAEAAQRDETAAEAAAGGGAEEIAEAETSSELVEEAAAAEGDLAVSIAADGGAGRLIVGAASDLQQEQARAAAVTVRAKAGWFPGDTPSLSCISENGIVTAGGRDYLLCVMTGAPYGESNALRTQDLIRAVFGLRTDLAAVASPGASDAPAAESEATA